MVKLSTHSPYSNKDTPFLYRWDVEYRRNYDTYQTEIDKITYSIQRTIRGFGPFGSWLYPALHQKDILLLQLYKRKQVIGKIFPEEIDEFVGINPNIHDNLKNTFRAGIRFPTLGFGIGIGLNVYAQMFNLPYSFRLGFLVVPMLAEIIYNVSDVEARIKSLEFLDWLTQYRTAKAQLEFDAPQLKKDVSQIFQKFRHTSKNTTTVEELHNQLVKLVAETAVDELKF